MKKSKIKTQEQLIKRLKELENTMDNMFWSKAVIAVNQYIKHNPQGLNPDNNYISRLSDTLCTNGAWIYDRVQGKTATIHNADYKNSLTKKIREALGFTF